MDKNAFQLKLEEIAAHVLAHRKYIVDDWDLASIVITLEEGVRQANGYVYRKDHWEARTPSGGEFKTLCKELQDITRAPSGEAWKQALLHIDKSKQDINVKFEYDDPKRWSLKKVSLDLEDYAMSLHPNAA